ncbi:MAG: hypothetical protein ABIR66_04250 [Saprospiraceae bacterium]
MQSVFSFLISCLLLVNSIPAIAQKKLAKYPKSIIYFGNGGGFTGFETTYALLESGDVYKKNGFQDQCVYLCRLKPNETKQIFSNYEFLGLSAIELNEPGNTYSFIEFSNSNTKHKLTWDRSGSGTVPGNLKLFNSLLLHFVQNQ